MKTAFWYLVCCLIPLVLIIPIAVILWMFGTPITNGQQRVTVTAIDSHGLIWKTERVFVRAIEESDLEDRYCITSDEIKTKLRDANISRQQVLIGYNKPSFVGPWECGKEYAIIQSVENIISP